MSPRFVYAVVFGLLLIGAPAVKAATLPCATLEIPFAFHVGTSYMPAGEYRVEGGPTERAMSFRQLNGRAFAIVFAIPKDRTIEGTRSRLVFHRYGDSYFLRQVLIVGREGVEFPRSKAEREQILAQNRVEKLIVSAVHE